MISRVVITGATGFVGRALCAALEKCDPPVSVLALGRRSLAITKSIHSVSVDLLERTQEALDEIEKFRPQVIVQLAALAAYAPPSEQNSTYEKINTEVPLKIAELAERLGALNVFASTDLVFDGTSPPYLPTSTTNPFTIYGKTKRATEEALLTSGKSLVVRFSQLIGLHGTFFAVIHESLTKGRPIDLFNDEFRSILCVDDAIKLLLGLIRASLRGEVNLSVPWNFGGPQPVSRYEIGLELADVMKVDKSLIIPCSAAAVSKIPRPKDTTMESSETYSAAAYTPRSAKEAIRYAAADIYPPLGRVISDSQVHIWDLDRPDRPWP